jgi:peptidoglycan/LPS O-acetylase OafA/YrhL
MVVSLGVFLVMCPLFFLLAGFVGQFLPQNALGLFIILPGIPFIILSLFLTHICTEKLSQRWTK